jgi:hypothetical protein
VDVYIKNKDKEMAIHLAANLWEMIPAKLFRLIMDKTNDIKQDQNWMQRRRQIETDR